MRAEVHLAAGAIATAFLLAGIGGAVAGADTGDSAGSENKTSAASDSGPDSAENSADNNSFSGQNVGDQADRAVETRGIDTNDSAREQSVDEHTGEKAADHAPGTGDCPGDKTINRAPLRPEAPPPFNLGPLPPPPLAPAPEAPPPADLPPVPATPADPDPIDSVGGEGGHRPGGYEPPVLTVPVLVAPAPIPAVHILGASIAPHWTPGARAVDPAPRPAGEPSPRLLRASADSPPLRDPMLTSFGVTMSGQPYRPGYSGYSSGPVGRIAAGALPGVAGLVAVTAFGICLGYRQAKTAQQLRTGGFDRFVN